MNAESKKFDVAPGVSAAPTGIPVMIVDDDPALLRAASVVLRKGGISNVLTVERGREALNALAEERVGVLILDLALPDVSGQEVLDQVSSEYPEVSVIIMTAATELDTVIECMRKGASDYLVKPVDNNRFISAVFRAIEVLRLREEVYALKERFLLGELRNPQAFSRIITQNKKMRLLFQYVEAVAGSKQPVLITGETGVGKELFAEAIHAASHCKGNLIAVNVAGLDDTMFTDTLFGHMRGAFTGAERFREGLIYEAADGTLFLDEIGDLTEHSQVKLLRLLHNHEYYPLGADQARRSTARIIIATNQAIEDLVNKGRFRKDLYFRLRAHQIRVPPLRERKEDLPALIKQILLQAAKSMDKKPPTPPLELFDLLKTHHFPGNVRELEAMIHDAVAQHQGGILSLKSFKEAVGFETLAVIRHRGLEDAGAPKLATLFPDRLPTLAESEEFLVSEALKRANGNQGIAAGMLGLTRQALNKRLIRQKRKMPSDVSH